MGAYASDASKPAGTEPDASTAVRGGGHPFVDTTEALKARVEAGENVHSPDESHLNELGEAAVAETLAAFLSSHSGHGVR